MKKIASHENVEIFAPGNSRFSFLKSPYAAHKTGSAVDIYYGTFGGEAASPADGKIIDIRSFDAPTPFKGRNSKEYIIALQHDSHAIKILHVKPDVSVGENISAGDKIGTFIKNGYFIFWNDPVMHVEVRPPDDYLRASNVLRLTPEIEWSSLSFSKTLELECRVEEIKDNYSFLSTVSADYDTCGHVEGFAMDGGFLDGYVPSNHEGGFFGLIRPAGFFHPGVSKLEITVRDREVECAGLAFCLSFNEPRIKVIPKKYGDEFFSIGDNVNIRIQVQ
ncbi:MAG TPA: hypothetical protein VIO58_09250 [Candidatus Methanoperedens sp.]